jgi:serine/threonine-protein kinase RsbW
MDGANTGEIEIRASMARKSKTKPATEMPGEVRLSLPSCLGYERIAMESAAAMARMMGFAPPRVEDLRTAVSETCINAFEHGNKLNAANRVDVLLRPNDETLIVQVFDNGTGFESSAQIMPQIEKKIHGEEISRGWGLFLIERLVDHVEFKTMPKLGHVTTLTMKLSP